VNSVSPGLIPTQINKERLADPAEAERLLAQIPLGRLGRPEDVVGIVALLLSEHAGWITGADILVDGGSLAG
jgi:3-oxoacyl-[acyl-carrier protein] reductase